jgi:AcrR family transcriptional regulator
MPKAFSAREKQLITRRLLEEGYRGFSTYGLKKTSVEDLARAAGISKGAFYIFYESKEALFMDVIEKAEKRLRREILAMIDLPGASPRLRLLAILKQAFAAFETIPILQFLTSSDYELLFRRIPPEKFQEHLASDRAFFVELIARCQAGGIPIQAQPEQIAGLLYPIVLSRLHQDDFRRLDFGGNFDLLLELVAAFSLGEIELQGAANSDWGLESENSL